jgi:hypothetical protein
MQRPQKGLASFEDISHHFLSVAEADNSDHATGTAGHLHDSDEKPISDAKPASPKKSNRQARRKDTCAACAHLLPRAGQPFQCRIFSIDYARFNVEHREKIDLAEGRTCPFFMRVTSRQLEDILRSHGSPLVPEQVREYAQDVDEEIAHTKTIAISARAGTSAEEVLREELLRYLMDGYSIVEATVVLKEEQAEDKRSKTTTHTVKLRLKEEG